MAGKKKTQKTAEDLANGVPVITIRHKRTGEERDVHRTALPFFPDFEEKTENNPSEAEKEAQQDVPHEGGES